MPRKFSPYDRMLVAAMIESGIVSDRNSSGGVQWSIECADALLTALAETPAPACVDPDGYGPMASLERAMNTAFRHVLGDLANLQGHVK